MTREPLGQNRRNAGYAEDRIQQRAIFGAEARDFVLLRGDSGALLIIFCTLAREFRALPGDFGFECACAARGSTSLTINGGDAPPDLTNGYFHGCSFVGSPADENPEAEKRADFM